MSVDKLRRKDFIDYEFIFSEVRRFLKMKPPEIFKHLRQRLEDNLHCLYGPNRRMYLFSAEGNKRFMQIAERGIRSLGIDGQRHDFGATVAAVKAEFMRRAVGADCAITEENTSEVFEQSITSLAATYRATTHYVPCSIAADQKPDRFEVGPVTFMLHRSFVSEYGAQLQEGLTTHSSQLLPEMLKFFSDFRWVAIVEVQACHANVSSMKAQQTIQRGLDLFKLFVRSHRASGVRQAYDLNAPHKTSHLVSKEGSFSISWSGQMRDAVVADDWYSYFAKTPYWTWAESHIAAAHSHWTELDEPRQRFLDALAWHGAAVSEPQAETRILKFWIAIERIVSLKPRDQIERRAAVLHCEDPRDFERAFRHCQRLYSRRSEIVHGASSQTSTDYTIIAHETEEVARNVLLRYLNWLDMLRSRGAFSRDDLADLYRHFDAQSKTAAKRHAGNRRS